MCQLIEVESNVSLLTRRLLLRCLDLELMQSGLELGITNAAGRVAINMQMEVGNTPVMQCRLINK